MSEQFNKEDKLRYEIILKMYNLGRKVELPKKED